MEAIIVETLLPDPLQTHQSHHENAFQTFELTQGVLGLMPWLALAVVAGLLFSRSSSRSTTQL